MTAEKPAEQSIVLPYELQMTFFFLGVPTHKKVVEADIWMAAEDFAYYSQVTDSCFYLLGTGNKEKGIVSSLHTPTFDIDEDALEVSTGLMAYIAIKGLEGESRI